MKILLITSLLLSATAGFSKEIQGTLVLKGTLKSKVMINNVKTVCRVKIEKVRNLMDEEDSFGNPAYQIRTQIELNGNEHVKYNKEVIFINLFNHGATTQVEDFKFFVKADPAITMKIDEDGHVVQVSFPLQKQIVLCHF